MLVNFSRTSRRWQIWKRDLTLSWIFKFAFFVSNAYRAGIRSSFFWSVLDILSVLEWCTVLNTSKQSKNDETWFVGDHGRTSQIFFVIMEYKVYIYIASIKWCGGTLPGSEPFWCVFDFSWLPAKILCHPKRIHLTIHVRALPSRINFTSNVPQVSWKAPSLIINAILASIISPLHVIFCWNSCSFFERFIDRLTDYSDLRWISDAKEWKL